MAVSAESGNVPLTLVVNDYDHTRDLATGRVPVEGVSLTCMTLPVEEIFFRFTRFREWDVSELSLAKYCALRASGDESLVAIPVFPSRSFRHSAFYVRADGPVDDPWALRGARVGFPEWTVTATVYARALLQHDYGIDLTEVQWVQAGTNEPGRIETLPVSLPIGIRVEPAPKRTLNELLISGEIDAMVCPHPPDGFTDRSGRIVRLFSDCPREEEDYFQRTKIFPIMHVIVIRADVHKRHPWVAMNLFKAFQKAKERSLERALDSNAPRYPVPWAPAGAQRAEQMFGPDFWPYGVEANRVTLEAFLRFATDQGLCAQELKVEKLFASQTLTSFRI